TPGWLSALAHARAQVVFTVGAAPSPGNRPAADHTPALVVLQETRSRRSRMVVPGTLARMLVLVLDSSPVRGDPLVAAIQIQKNQRGPGRREAVAVADNTPVAHGACRAGFAQSRCGAPATSGRGAP